MVHALPPSLAVAPATCLPILRGAWPRCSAAASQAHPAAFGGCLLTPARLFLPNWLISWVLCECLATLLT